MSLDTDEVNIISGFSMDDGNVPDTNITIETGKEGQVVSLNSNLNVIDDIHIIKIRYRNPKLNQKNTMVLLS